MSTQNAIKCLTNNIYQAVDKSKPYIGVFIDLAKTSTLQTITQFYPLWKTEVKGTANDLFGSYSPNRKQKLKHKQVTNCMFGVLQGTVLGPMVYKIYLNNLFLIEEDNKIIKSADEIVKLYTGENCF